MIEDCKEREPEYREDPIDYPGEAIVSHSYSVDEENNQGRPECDLAEYEARRRISLSITMRQLNGIRYARSECEDDLEYAQTQSEQ